MKKSFHGGLEICHSPIDGGGIHFRLLLTVKRLQLPVATGMSFVLVSKVLLDQDLAKGTEEEE